MNKQWKIPRYKRILALGDTSDMTAAEIADRLDLCVTDVTSAIYYAQKDHGVDIPYVKVYGGKRIGSGRKKQVAAIEIQPYPEPEWPERCKRCKYYRPESSNYTKSPPRCHYCHDTGHTRGYPLKKVVPVSAECDKFEPNFNEALTQRQILENIGGDNL